MPLLPTTELWKTTIEGAAHLVCDFAMPIGATEGAARMRAWTIWSHARANGSNDPDAPVPARGLSVSLVATAMVELPELQVA